MEIDVRNRFSLLGLVLATLVEKWLLRSFLGTMTCHGSKTEITRYLSLDQVEKFAGVARIQNLTAGLHLESLPRDDMRALRAFRWAIRWKEEGKPDGYHGPDWGDNPLTEKE